MKFYIACVQKINEIVQNSLTNKDEKFVTCPSLRVFESSDFNFLSGENLKNEDFLNCEDISMQFNSISFNENFWDIDPNLNLFERFKSRVENLKTTSKEDLKIELEQYFKLLYNSDESETELLERYKEKLSEYEDLVEQFQEIIDFYNDDLSDEEKKAISLKLDVVDKRKDLHLAEWKLNGLKEKVDIALSKINHLTEFEQFLTKLKRIKSDIENAKATGIQSLNVFAKLQIVPFDFYKNDFAWSLVEVTNKDLDSLFSKAKQSLKGFKEDLLGFDYDENFIEKVTFKYCVIHLNRPWLVNSLLKSNFVTVEDAKNALYAKKIVLIRDLRVILKENLSVDEKNNIEKNNIIKFGPIFMKSQLFKNKLSQKDFIKPITNKQLYKSKVLSKIDTKIIKDASVLMATKPQLMKANFALQPQVLKAQVLTAQVLKSQKLGGKKNTQKVTAKNLKLSNKNILKNLKPTILKNPVLFHKINWTNTSNQSNVHFSIFDKLSNEPIYKTEISIRSRSSSFYKEIETNQEGKITFQLPPGSYDIMVRKNGFKEMKFIQNIQKNKNVTISKKLEPEEIIYDSYFLMGVIGEQMII